MDVEWRRWASAEQTPRPAQTAGMGWGALCWRLRYLGEWRGSVGRRSEEARRREPSQKAEAGLEGRGCGCPLPPILCGPVGPSPSTSTVGKNSRERNLEVKRISDPVRAA